MSRQSINNMETTSSNDYILSLVESSVEDLETVYSRLITAHSILYNLDKNDKESICLINSKINEIKELFEHITIENKNLQEFIK